MHLQEIELNRGIERGQRPPLSPTNKGGKRFKHCLANTRAIQELAGAEHGGGVRQIKRFSEIVQGGMRGQRGEAKKV